MDKIYKGSWVDSALHSTSLMYAMWCSGAPSSPARLTNVMSSFHLVSTLFLTLVILAQLCWMYQVLKSMHRLRWSFFGLQKFILKTMIFRDVTTVLNERKHLQMVIRSVPDSVLVCKSYLRPSRRLGPDCFIQHNSISIELTSNTLQMLVQLTGTADSLEMDIVQPVPQCLSYNWCWHWLLLSGWARQHVLRQDLQCSLPMLTKIMLVMLIGEQVPSCLSSRPPHPCCCFQHILHALECTTCKDQSTSLVPVSLSWLLQLMADVVNQQALGTGHAWHRKTYQ